MVPEVMNFGGIGDEGLLQTDVGAKQRSKAKKLGIPGMLCLKRLI